MGMGQNPIPLVNIKIAGKWMFIPLKMVCIGIDPYPYEKTPSSGHVLAKKLQISHRICPEFPTFPWNPTSCVSWAARAMSIPVTGAITEAGAKA